MEPDAPTFSRLSGRGWKHFGEAAILILRSAYSVPPPPIFHLLNRRRLGATGVRSPSWASVERP